MVGGLFPPSPPRGAAPEHLSRIRGECCELIAVYGIFLNTSTKIRGSNFKTFEIFETFRFILKLKSILFKYS